MANITTPPEINGTLRKFMLKVPEVIERASGIKIMGKLIKSLVFIGDAMQKLKKIILLGIPLYFLLPLSVFAVTPEEVAAVGKEQSAAGVFIWFLCAIAFLKVSQKIDSFMASEISG